MLKIIRKFICDICENEIDDTTQVGRASILGKDYCPTCLSLIHEEVEKEYHRVVMKEVPTRRGGYRKIGELDT